MRRPGPQGRAGKLTAAGTAASPRLASDHTGERAAGSQNSQGPTFHRYGNTTHSTLVIPGKSPARAFTFLGGRSPHACSLCVGGVSGGRGGGGGWDVADAGVLMRVRKGVGGSLPPAG